MSDADNEFVFRPIQAADNPPMAAIIREVMTGFGCDGPGFAMQDAEVDSLAESYSVAGHRYFILSRHNKILGGAGIAPLAGGKDGVCELRKMYFLDAARGKGLGQKMGELCLKTARDMGYKLCYLETMSFMNHARKLYKKLGFKELDKAMGDTGHFGCDYYYSVDLTAGQNS
ncbi:MAG: GNAT family N-acetyltransferase [Planctomycetota bacterium]|nr:GNAT family N-acetyltransferase [Planctomycetota bacterium]